MFEWLGFEWLGNFFTSVGNLIGSAATTVASAIKIVVLSLFIDNSNNSPKSPAVKTTTEQVKNVEKKKQKKETAKRKEEEEKLAAQEQERQRLEEEKKEQKKQEEQKKQKDVQEAERLEQEQLANLSESTNAFNTIVEKIKKSEISNLLKENNLPQTYWNKLPENRKAQFEKDFVNAYKAQELIYSNKLPVLIQNFYEYIQTHGSDAEKAFFKAFENANPEKWIFRLFEARNLMYLWYNGSLMIVTKNGTELNPTYDSKEIDEFKATHNLLTNYITDNEQLISPFVSVFGPTFFINDGDRKNHANFTAQFNEQDDCITTGYHVGLVGPSFERNNTLEYRHMIITQKQNTNANGYGNGRNDASSAAQFNKIFEAFYDLQSPFMTFDEARADLNQNQEQDDLIVLNPWQKDTDQQIIFSRAIYKKRMEAVIVPFLDRVNKQAKTLNKAAVIYAIGLGLGNWTSLENSQTNGWMHAIPETSKIKSFITAHFNIPTKTHINTLTLLGTCIQIQIYKEWFNKNEENSISDLIFGYMGWNDDFKKLLLTKEIFDTNTSMKEEKISFIKSDKEITQFKIDCGKWGRTNIICSTLNPSSNKFFTAEKEADRIRFIQYPWDGNAFPGNELWGASKHFGMNPTPDGKSRWSSLLGASGDPAAMSSALSAPLQNPILNHIFKQKYSITDK